MASIPEFERWDPINVLSFNENQHHLMVTPNSNIVMLKSHAFSDEHKKDSSQIITGFSWDWSIYIYSYNFLVQVLTNFFFQPVVIWAGTTRRRSPLPFHQQLVLYFNANYQTTFWAIGNCSEMMKDALSASLRYCTVPFILLTSFWLV